LLAITEKRAVALTVLAGVLWGTSFVAIKAGLEYVEVFWFVFLRMLLASAAGAVLLLLTGKFRFSFLKIRTVWTLGVLSGIAFLLQYLALLFTTASKTSLLVNLSVIGVALLSWRLYGERFGSRGLAALILGVVGLFLLTTNGGLSPLISGQALGDLLALLTAVIWAFFTILSKKLVTSRASDVYPISIWVLLTTAITLLPFATSSGAAPVLRIPPVGWMFILYIAVFCTTIPYSLWNFGLTRITPTNSALILLIEILVAFLGGVMLLGESLGVVAAVGAVLTFVAIILGARGPGAN
jgi:drug/metabolite transporter (DMT)-like permease